LPAKSSIVRRSLVLIAAVFAVSCVAAVIAGASSARPFHHRPFHGRHVHGTYLALGDSVAFGYVPPQAVPAPNYNRPRSFVGYPELLGRRLHERDVNASCPGETTASMLVAGAQSNGCENSLGSPVGYRTLYPLHVHYRGTQMQFALRYLAFHRHTRLITIDIGANDAFLCQETTVDQCGSPVEFAGVAAQITSNLGTILKDLRGQAHYRGPIVVLTYYSLSYSDPAQIQSTEALDSVIAGAATANGAIVADGFAAFQAPSLASGGDPCAAGLLIKLPGGTCNIHPSRAGHRLLAKAILKALGA
jgi:lysophospholipase L1-like esterase